MKYTRDKRRFREREIAARRVKTAEKLFMSFLHGALLEAQVIRRRARANLQNRGTIREFCATARDDALRCIPRFVIIRPHVNARGTLIRNLFAINENFYRTL